MAEDENVKEVAEETKKVSRSVSELAKQMKDENAKARKAEKTAIENERSKLDRLAKEIQAQGGRVEDNATYVKEELLLKKRELELSSKNAPFFSEARAQFKKQAKLAKVQARNTTFLGKIQNALTGNKVSASAAKEQQKDAAAADEKTNTILGKIGAGIGGLLDMGKDAAKNVGKTGLQIFKGTVVAAFLFALAAFLKSPYFKQTLDFIEKEVVPRLKSFYENVLVPIGNVLKDVFIRQWENIKVLFDDLGTAIEQFKSGDILGGITTLITGIGTFFLKTVDNLITGVYNLFAKMFGLEETDSVGASIGKFFTDLGGKITKFFTDTYDKIVTSISTTFNNIVETVSNYITGLYETVSTFISEKIDSLFASLKGIATTIKEFFSTRIDTAIETITKDFNEVIFFITNLEVFKFFKDSINDVMESIKSIFAGDFSLESLLPGGKGLFDLVTAPINIAINTIKDIFGLGEDNSDFGLNEPFRLSEFIGGIITDAIKVITDWFGSLKIPSVGDLITMAKDGFTGLVSSLFGGGSEEDKLKKELDEINKEIMDDAASGDSRKKLALEQRQKEIKKVLDGEAPVGETSTVVTENKELQEDFNKPRPSKKTEVDFKGTRPSEMSAEQLNAAIIDYKKVRDSKKGQRRVQFDRANTKYRISLQKRRLELKREAEETAQLEKDASTQLKMPESGEVITGSPSEAQFTTVREKPSAEVIETRRKAGLADNAGRFDYDVVKKVPVSKSSGGTVINAPSTTNAPTNNNSTNVAANTFVDPDAFMRRQTQFAI